MLKKELREGYEYYRLRHGGIFNVLNCKDPSQLEPNDEYAYYTYKELMGEKENMGDLGQVFLKNNEAQKCVDYYEDKIKEV